MSIKIKEVVVVITLKELSAANSRKKQFWNILPRCVMSRSTAVLPKLVSKPYQKEQNLSCQDRHLRVVFFNLAGFCFQIKSNTISLTSVAK